MEKKRMDYVDIARGLAILLVIFGHVKYEYVPFCGSVHISVFFLLSGYLYQFGKDDKSLPSFGSLVSKRTKRLLIPYFIYSAVLYLKYLAKLVLSHGTVKEAINAALGCIYSSSIIFKNVAPEDNFSGFVFGNGPLWFLTAMVVSCVVFYALTYFVLKNQFHLGKIVALMLALCAATWALCRFLPIYLPWTAEMALIGTVFMFLGAIARQYDLVELLKKHPLFGLASSIVSVILFTLLHAWNGLANMAACEYGRSVIAFVILGALGNVVVLYISIMIEKVTGLSKAIAYIGQRTMIILAFHMTIIALFVSALDKVHLSSLAKWDGIWVVNFAVGLVSCLVLGEILHRFFKVPKSML